MEMAEVVTSLDTYRERKQQLRNSGFVPTGSLGLNGALGGGWKAGRIAELAGDYSTYKTSLALHSAAWAQKTGKVLWLDPVGDFNPQHARNCGAKLNQLILQHPTDALDVMATIKDVAPFFRLIVVDNTSLLAMPTLWCDWDQELGWVKAELSTTSVLFLTSIKNYSPLDQAVARWSSQIVRLYPDGEGKVRVIAHKSAGRQPPVYNINLRYSAQATIDVTYELVLLAVQLGVIEVKGSWYYFRGTKLGQGADGAIRGLGYTLENALRREIEAHFS